MIPTYLERVYPDQILSSLDPETKPVTCSGDRYKPTYHPVTDDDGHFDLKEKGVVDVYAQIQSHKDSVDINRIISRFENGDVNALNKYEGFYDDVSNMPKTYAEVLQRISDAEVIFNQLPLDVREQFDHDVNQFIASFGTEKFAAVFDKKDIAAESPAASDVVDVVKEEGEVVE